jgi:hypothetical protein
VNISAANLNKSLRRYLIADLQHFELVESFLIPMFEHCQPEEIIQIIQKVYSTIESDLLHAEMYELFKLMEEAKQEIGRLFCTMANKNL